MKTAINTLDPLNLVHKGGSVLSNIFTPWKGTTAPKTAATDPNAAPDGGVVPAPVQPVMPTDQAALNAEQTFTQGAMAQKSFSKTIFAGDTGGYRPGAQPGRPGGL